MVLGVAVTPVLPTGWAPFKSHTAADILGRNAFAYYDTFTVGATTNANTLTATDYEPGSACTFTSTTSTGGAGVYFVAALTTGSLNVGAFGTLLVSTTFLSPTPLLMPGGTLTVTVPFTVPSVVYAQAVETTGPATPTALRELSNGIVLVAENTENCDTWTVKDGGKTTLITNATQKGTLKVTNNGNDKVKICINDEEKGEIQNPGTAKIGYTVGDKVEIKDDAGNQGAKGTFCDCDC